MVEIIKQGELKFYQVKCNRCDSILKFTKEDESCSNGNDFLGEPTTDYSIVCPKCNADVPTRSITNEGFFSWMTPIDVNKI